MRKIGEIQGEEALDVLAELLDPVAEIAADTEIVDTFRSGNQMGAIKMALKGHKTAVINALAILEGENPVEYAKKVRLITLPAKILEVLNDPDLASLF